MINKEKHITRREYTLCFLSKLQDSLRRRDIYVTGSNRWGYPREKLLQGADWQSNRIKVYRSLGAPDESTGRNKIAGSSAEHPVQAVRALQSLKARMKNPSMHECSEINRQQVLLYSQIAGEVFAIILVYRLGFLYCPPPRFRHIHIFFSRWLPV